MISSNLIGAVKKAGILSILLLAVFILPGCRSGKCIGDCTFDMDVDIGLLMYQPSDFNNTCVRLKIPPEALAVHDDHIMVSYRGIETRLQAEGLLLREIQDLPDSEIFLYLSIADGSMILKGMRL